MQIAMENLPCTWDLCVVKARTCFVRFFRYMAVLGHNTDVSSRRCGGAFVRVRGWCLNAAGSCVS